MTRIPYGIKTATWEGWNSFPSDHTVLFFALATGIFFASRRAGVFMFIYVSAFIFLPRLYLGIHYPTDVLSGALVGISAGWVANRPAMAGFLSDWAFRWLDARPG
jgi:undecaprenyl-diphosphatase